VSVKKTAIVFYSAGKDSHLALLSAVKKGYSPFLVTFRGGKNHRRYFNDLPKVEIVKEQAGLMGFPIFVCGVKSHPDSFLFERVMVFLKNKIFVRNGSDKIAHFSSNDYQEEKRDKTENKKFIRICSRLDIAFIPFKKIIKEDATFAPIGMALKEKVESIIVSTDVNVDRKWLGRRCDGKFVGYIKGESQKGNKIDANNFQTLVVKSPLFKKRLKILKHSIFAGGERGQAFLKVDKYEFE